MSLKDADEIELKRLGYIKQRQDDMFTVRIPIPCGAITAGQIIRLGEISSKYGNGELHLTERQGIQIPWIPLASLDDVKGEIEKNMTPAGSSGPRLRNVTACPGAAECRFGIIETKELGKMLAERYHDAEFPIKIKFSITGCPNSCAKPHENDVGIMGIEKVTINAEKCDGCMMCSLTCKQKAIIIENGKALLSPQICVYCGDCIDACPKNLIVSVSKEYLILVGGKIGRHPQLGFPLISVGTRKELLEIMDRIVEWIKLRVEPGERFGSAINRTGMEKFRREVLTHPLSNASTESGVCAPQRLDNLL